MIIIYVHVYHNYNQYKTLNSGQMCYCLLPWNKKFDHPIYSEISLNEDSIEKFACITCCKLRKNPTNSYIKGYSWGNVIWSKVCYQQKGIITRNTNAKYESPASSVAKAMANNEVLLAERQDEY